MFCVIVDEKLLARHTTESAVVDGSAIVSPVKAAAVKVTVKVTSLASNGRDMWIPLWTYCGDIQLADAIIDATILAHVY
jgi:hypothetical protein